MTLFENCVACHQKTVSRTFRRRGIVHQLKPLAALSAGLVVLGIVTWATPTAGQAPSSPRAPSTEAMAARLEAFARESALRTPPASSLVETLIGIIPRPELLDQLRHGARLANALLEAGRSEDAAAVSEAVLRDARANPGVVSAAFTNGIHELAAIAHLRVDTQENCVLDRASQRCSVPIGPDAVHPNQRGSRRAIELYTELLVNAPDDVTAGTAQWLLNIAYMTLGEHPHRVPEAWRIPAEAFLSEYDITRFPDVASRLGLDVIGRAGGSVMDDFDRDGDLDIIASSRGLRDQLRYFRNNGDGTFTDVTVEAGLEGMVGGLNLVHADYDNDGFLDLLVLRGGWMDEGHPNSLLRNNGDGTFTDVTEDAGLLAPSPTQTAAWGDYDNDGWLDLFIGTETLQRETYPCQLFHNNGDGTFTDVAADAGVAVVGFVKGVVWGDYDNDGRLDLYVTHLSAEQPNQLFHNEGPTEDGTWRFRDVAAEAGVAGPPVSFPTWFFDYDNDGWLDLFVAGFRGTIGDLVLEYLGRPHGGQLPRLYHNDGDGTFSDVTRAARVDTLMSAMGSNYGDLDNDGFLDFYVGTGDPDYRAIVPNRMLRNADGEFFQDVTASGGFGHLQKGHGVAFGDLDADGDQDIYQVVGGAYEGDTFQNALFLNPGHGNGWITLRLQGVASNRAAIGARIRMTVATPTGDRDIHATVSSGGSFGGSSLQQEIGLGTATAIRTIAIVWPATGKTDVYADVRMNRTFSIREGDPTPTPVAVEPLDLQ